MIDERTFRQALEKIQQTAAERDALRRELRLAEARADANWNEVLELRHHLHNMMAQLRSYEAA